MRARSVFLMAIAPLVLCALGGFVRNLSWDIRERARSESVVEFVERALDAPDKLDVGHVRTVLRAARTMEELERRAEEGLAQLIAGIAHVCFAVALFGFLTIGLVSYPLGAGPPPPRSTAAPRG